MLAILLTLVGVIGWCLQDQLFLNWDVSQLLHGVDLMLGGGTYSHDFFDPNPPSVLLLYAPPVILNKWFGFNIVLTFRAYIFLLSAVSLYQCCVITKSIFSKHDNLIRNCFLMALAITFFILPSYQLGQRDCLLYVFIFPYLLLVVSRLQANTISKNIAIYAGFMAGLGVALKPQFLILPCLIESYYLLRTRKISSIMRPETIMMAGVSAIFLAITVAFYSDYIQSIVPYMLKNYYVAMARPWQVLLFEPIILFCLLTALCVMMQYKQLRYRDLFTLLLIAMAGYFVCYLSQQSLLLYHVLPIYFVAVILVSLQFSSHLRAAMGVIACAYYAVLFFGGHYPG